MSKSIVLAAVFALTAPGAAFAGETGTTVRVGYADLDLATASGRIALDKRISRAIAQACPKVDDVRDLAGRNAMRRCRAARMAETAAARDLAIARAGQTRIGAMQAR